MSEHQPKDSAFKSFMRGFYELPREERPNLFHSFLRGGIIAALLSLVFPVSSAVELVIWVILAGAGWSVIDFGAWKYYQKKGV